jgi:hypothetical protein
MKRYSILVSFIYFQQILCQPCAPTAISSIENQYIKAGVGNMGDFYPGVVGGGLEYPKRTPVEIANGVRAKSPIFSASIWLSSIDNGNVKISGIRYRSPVGKAHFFPGPIRLKDGTVHAQSCTLFDKIWIVKKQDIQSHIQQWSTSPSPLTTVQSSIKDWPAKGNKQFVTVPIEDELAPFVDVNNNGTYDPENGDYPKIKGDEAHFAVMNDVSANRSDAIGVELHILTYIYDSPIFNGIGTSIFHDCKVIKKTAGNADELIMSLFVDSDLGNFNDDYVGCDTLSSTGYTYNADDFDENTSVPGYFNNPPVVSTSFVSRKMNAFSYFINGQGGSLNDPTTPEQMRKIMEGKTNNGGTFTVSNDGITPGFPSTRYLFYGNPSDSNEWSMHSRAFLPRDLRYLMSSEKSLLEFKKPQNLNFVTYIHRFKPYQYPPNFRDSVLPELDKVKNYTASQECKINLKAKITPDTNRMKKGKVEITNISNSQGTLIIKWSSNETTQSISSKDSGKYRVVIIDANNCMKDSTFYIPLITKGTGGIAQSTIDNITIYPNPIENHLTIKNPNQLKIENIYIYDVLGKLIYQTTINSRNETSELGLKTLTQGNYHMSISTEHGMKNFKITK